MRWCLVALGAAFVAGCSLIYNPNNLPDPRMIDAAVVDSNPCAVQIDGIAPARIDEGQGDGGSAPALLVLHGNNFVNSGLQVELRAPGGTKVLLAPVSDAIASADTTYLAFTVTAHVDIDLAASVPLDVVVTQECAKAALAGTLALQGLPELTPATLPADTARLESKYSMVHLPAVTLRGGVPAVITAVASMDLGEVTASASGSTAGPGAVSGGATAGGGPGGGGIGGNVNGLGLGSGGGGGGAGYVTDGDAGGAGGGIGGGAGGAAGHQCGDDMLVSGVNDRGSAGGAGGAGSVSGASPGGAGGGGGGTVLLTAGGNLTVSGILANGDVGGNPSGGGGGGGGGAGGTVLVSTAGGTLQVGPIHVAGGGGGKPGGSAGAPGRVRFDAPRGDAPTSPETTPHRGLAFSGTARMVTKLPQQITLLGAANHGFTVRVIDQSNLSHDAGHGVFDPGGTAVIAPPLYAGYNLVCALLDGGAPGTIAERCTDLAFLP